MSGPVLTVLAESSIRALALALAGGIAALFLRRTGAHVRHALWLVVACGMLALPVLSVVVRRLPVTGGVWKAAAPGRLTIELLPPSNEQVAKPVPPSWRPDWRSALWDVYLLAAAVAAARLLNGARRLRRLCSASRPEYVEMLDELAPPVGIEPAFVEIRSSPEVAVPFTAGVVRPVILLPESWREWPREKLAAVLVHELAHIARRDWLAARVAAANRCLFWFHPLAWWLERKLASLAEESADSTALAVIGDPRSYAGAILDFAFAMQGKRLRSMEATAMARTTKVGRRVERILAASHFRKATFRRGAVALIIAGALPLLYAAAALTPAPQTVTGEQIYPPVRVYTKAELTDETARQLEAALAQSPADPAARMKLISFYQQKGDLDSVRRHTWWLVENCPERIEAMMASAMVLQSASEDDKIRLGNLWSRPLEDPAALANASQTMMALGRLFDAEERLLGAHRAAPDRNIYASRLAYLYVSSILGVGYRDAFAGEWTLFTRKARSELETSPDAAVVGAAGEILLRQANSDWFDTAEKYLERARSLDSGNQRWIKALTFLTQLRNTPVRPVEAVTPDRVRVGGNAQQTKLIEQTRPVYPPLAKQARLQGLVRLSAIIGTDGTVKSLDLVSGHPLLAPAAIEAVRQWVYQPTLLNGKPVEVMTQIDVNFAFAEETAAKEAVSKGIEEGVTRPSLIRKVEPQFPEQLRHQGLTSTVVLRVVVTREGRIGDARVEKVAGAPEFGDAALQAVREWEFKPATKDGQPVDAAATIEVNFREK